MSTFHFPQAGEQQNASAIPVPVHTLHALLAAALAWELETEEASSGIVPSQVSDATAAVIKQLTNDEALVVARVAERLMVLREEAERRS